MMVDLKVEWTTKTICKECLYDDIKVALKVTRLFYMMLVDLSHRLADFLGSS